MIIAGLQKNSLIDFPGKIAAVVFVTGCNFACPFCHNPDLARGDYPQRIAIDQLLAFLRPRRSLLDGVVISGGEPTLAPGLADLCLCLRELELAVKLDTNGSRPDVLGHLIAEHLLDYVAMDLKTPPGAYAPPLAPERMGPKIGQSIRLIMDSNLDHEFRTTCVRPFVDETLITAMACEIQGARRYILQPFRGEHLLDPGYFDHGDPSFSSEEMVRLQALAAPWVQECSIRGS